MDSTLVYVYDSEIDVEYEVQLSIKEDGMVTISKEETGTYVLVDMYPQWEIDYVFSDTDEARDGEYRLPTALHKAAIAKADDAWVDSHY